MEENLRLHDQIKAQALESEPEISLPDPNEHADSMFTTQIEEKRTSIVSQDVDEAIGILSDPVALQRVV